MILKRLELTPTIIPFLKCLAIGVLVIILKEAIIWSWELLTKVYKINSENLYVTFFEGSNEDKLNADFETKELWENILPK